jgi:hypothetical protein
LLKNNIQINIINHQISILQLENNLNQQSNIINKKYKYEILKVNNKIEIIEKQEELDNLLNSPTCNTDNL